MTSEPLRICLLSVAYPPENTHGVARSTHSLAQGLAELGHEVHVITAGDRHSVTFRDGAYIHEVAGQRSPRYEYYRSRGMPHLANWLNHSHAVFDRIRSLMADHDIQIVDSPLWNLDGLVTAVADRLPVCVRVVTSMKQISTIHERDIEENQILGDLETEFLGRAAGIISNSEGTVTTLRKVYELDLERMPHFRATYGMVPSSDAEIRGDTETRKDSPTVLFVGRLEKRKGILDLFEAIPAVLERHPDARFAIVGSDNSREDGFFDSHRMDYPSYFRKTYSRWTDSVDFHGFVDEDQLQDFYRECDLFVAPSLYESFGLIFLEAMNLARPVIGCRSGGPEEIIVHGETGLLIEPQDAKGLAEAISSMIESPERRRAMGLAGRNRLLEHYSHTAMAADFVQIYREILAEKRGRNEN
jgi:glycosyltransferase involved in cell wall biosynthesis